jgi:diguanylate cyclase (GGDEF)-like protein/PAS domain S-box-containing protein
MSVGEDQGSNASQTVDHLAGEGLSERLQFLLSETSFGTWDLDIKNGGVIIDDRWASMLGYESSELQPMSFEKFASLVHPDDLERTQSLVVEQFTGSQEPFDNTLRMQHKDGSWRFIRSRGRVTKFNEQGEPLLLTGINEDITQERQRDLELIVSRQQLESAQRIAGIGSWFLDLKTDQVLWSEELYRMQGLDPNESPPPAATHSQLFDDESWSRLTEALSLTGTEGTPYELELRMKRDGKFYGWMLARGEAVRDSFGNIVGIQGVALDITERKQTESNLEQRAAIDSLTGLGNRGLMSQRVEQALAAASRNQTLVGSLMIDLDYFKLINDTHGHAVGDSVLCEVANRLTDTTRGTDSVFRLGGDEFVVLLPGIKNAAIMEEVANRILAAFRKPIHLDGQEFRTTVSIGGAISDGSSSVSHLLRDTDTAMYTAKQNGRDQYSLFDDRQQLVLVERLALETEMREAVARSQFVVYYQPIWNLNSKNIVGAEALLRWANEKGEILDTKQFINVAEETGLMRELGAFSLREACRAGVQMLTYGLQRMHVNVSASQLTDPGFLDQLDTALVESGLEPGALCIEVTESTLLRELSVIRSNIFGIGDRGVHLALDDYGTGYAALAQLNDLPIDVLKLDRSIVRSAVRATSDARVLTASLVLAKALELTFIAEGIESEDQVLRLQELGCEIGQGRFLGEPINEEEFHKLLRHHF